jgi:hypothetical protein
MTASPPFVCRACGHARLDPVLSLGTTPLANALVRADQREAEEPRFPLELVFCPACSLTQITETVPPADLFREYVYFSSFSDTAVASARAIAERIVEERGLGASSLAMEVASNDGYLLQHYACRGVPVLGIEPARNIAVVAEERGIRTVSEFFGRDLAGQLAADGLRADILHANNVLAHVPDLGGFVDGIRTVLKPDGVAVIEVPYVRDMLDHVEFDTIYHEHLCYFSLTAVDRLFAARGLIVHDVERLAIHGGSLRLFVSPHGSRARGAAVETMLRDEQEYGLADGAAYTEFARRVEDLRSALLALLSRLKSDGKRIAAYGASAKGSTLLNYCGIGRETLDFVVDRSTVKQGLFTPGTHLPIRSVETLLEEMPQSVLLLTWNFAAEILDQQAEYRRRGGQFIIPVPQPHVA